MICKVAYGSHGSGSGLTVCSVCRQLYILALLSETGEYMTLRVLGSSSCSAADG